MTKLPIKGLSITAAATAFFFFSKPSPQPEITLHSPMLVVVGLDYSLSMTGAQPADTAFLRSLCRTLAQTQRPVTVAFEPIATPSNTPMLRLVLEPTQALSGLSLSKRASVAQQNRKIAVRNKAQTEQFLLNCWMRIEKVRRNAQWTDLNGHYGKAQRLMLEPQFEGYHKIIFTQTDGKHDLPKQYGKVRELICPEWPANTSVYVSNWQTGIHPLCEGVENVFESPFGFTSFLSLQFKQN